MPTSHTRKQVAKGNNDHHIQFFESDTDSRNWRLSPCHSFPQLWRTKKLSFDNFPLIYSFCTSTWQLFGQQKCLNLFQLQRQLSAKCEGKNVTYPGNRSETAVETAVKPRCGLPLDGTRVNASENWGVGVQTYMPEWGSNSKFNFAKFSLSMVFAYYEGQY